MASQAEIKSLFLARYRGFRERQQPDLSRLTLVYGENNAGKSALIRAPSLLAKSRTTGSPGLDLEASVLGGAGFREVQWRGPLPAEEDPDMVLGVGLADGASWRWTFRWLDEKSLAVIERLEVVTNDEKVELEIARPIGQSLKDVEYRGPDGATRLTFDGLVPRAGASPLLDRHRDALVVALDGVVWLAALRRGPGRGGTPRGARGSVEGDGVGASALVLADESLRAAVSAWFRVHLGYDVVATSLGAEMQRLVLRPIGEPGHEPGYDVPFPDAGEGLQQVFPLIVALERLRRDGGLLTVEEPESHLHPRLQRALSELIVDVLTKQPSASVLLETHSEVFLVAALRAAAGALSGSVRLYWIETQRGGAAVIEDVPLGPDGRPETPRLEQAFDTMGVMRRELIEERKAKGSSRRADGS